LCQILRTSYSYTNAPTTATTIHYGAALLGTAHYTGAGSLSTHTTALLFFADSFDGFLFLVACHVFYIYVFIMPLPPWSEALSSDGVLNIQGAHSYWKQGALGAAQWGSQKLCVGAGPSIWRMLCIYRLVVNQQRNDALPPSPAAVKRRELAQFRHIQTAAKLQARKCFSGA